MIHRQSFPNLRAYFKRTGVSKATLARRVGVHPSHISRIAAGTKVPSLQLASRIADETNVPIESMLMPAFAAVQS